MNAIFLSVVTLCLLLAPGESVHAQWRVPRSVPACGGLTMAGGGNTVVSTLGQTIIGRVSTGTDNAQFGFWYTFSSITVPVETPPNHPKAFELGNFPNPFSGSTTIRFTLGHASRVILEAYDPLGRKLATIANEIFDAGTHDIVFEAPETTAPGAARFLYVVMKTPSFTRALPVAVIDR
ncbi:MAG: hypothetical protein WC824_04115 [Bacteroidota bacterium]|jgi:hypothetical protein